MGCWLQPFFVGASRSDFVLLVYFERFEIRNWFASDPPKTKNYNY